MPAAGVYTLCTMAIYTESGVSFSDRYGRLRGESVSVRESAGEPVPEYVLQCVWYDQLFLREDLETLEGHRLEVASPGWWNHQAGPDFRGAQILFNGKLHTGDVEIHHRASSWRDHGHHLDPRYDHVILHVTLEEEMPRSPVRTSEGRQIPTLPLNRYLTEDIRGLADAMQPEEEARITTLRCGRCSEATRDTGPDRLAAFLDLAGEWRVLHKARALRQRMDGAGPDQAIYEAILYACGFGHFKHHFRAIARQLPYDRSRQLAQQDPLLLEAALLQIAGLLPDRLPKGTTSAPHYGRLRALRRDHLAGLRRLPLEWRRVGVRPNNNPERRLAGVARFVARTAPLGLSGSLERVWQAEQRPLERRRAFEALFPRATGFWASHCTWTGKRMARASAPIGPGRARSIIGNVFIPAGLALARRDRDREKEERVFAFFAALPKEPGNQIIRAMLPRITEGPGALKMSFRRQQGVLQMYMDWCESNPSCRHCTLLAYLRPEEPG